MGTIVISEFISLDGVIEDPGGAEGYRHGGWTFAYTTGPDGDRFKLDETLGAEALLLGRVTYEGFAAAWPTMEGTGELGEKMNAMPKYVVSSTSCG
jgi:dihydrofolate reductase